MKFLLALLTVIVILMWPRYQIFAQNTEEKRDISRCAVAIEEFQAADRDLENFFADSYGYAVFPGVGKGAIGVGGAHGKGILYMNGEPYGNTSMTQVSIGFQWGGQSYMEILFLEDDRAFENYVEGKVKLAAQASAVAATAGASADAKYNDGVAIFTLVKGGLMYEASVGGQKFNFKEWKD